MMSEGDYSASVSEKLEVTRQRSDFTRAVTACSPRGHLHEYVNGNHFPLISRHRHVKRMMVRP